MKWKWRTQYIAPYESFYRRASDRFGKGSIGGGRVDASNVMMT